MTKQKNGNWKITEDEMRDIMNCFIEGIVHLEEIECNALAKRYLEMYDEYSREDDK